MFFPLKCSKIILYPHSCIKFCRFNHLVMFIFLEFSLFINFTMASKSVLTVNSLFRNILYLSSALIKACISKSILVLFYPILLKLPLTYEVIFSCDLSANLFFLQIRTAPILICIHHTLL